MKSAPASTFDFLMGKLRTSFLSMPDKRSGNNTSYTIPDAASSAFSVFFTQEPSFLAYQRRMQKEHSVSNERTIFAVENTPSDTQIRRLLDEIPGKTV